MNNLLTENERDFDAMNSLITEYERDFDAWIQQHIALLKQGRFDEIDVDHLIIELEDMGRNHRRELANRFVLLIAHLLRWQYQYKQLQYQWGTYIAGSWKGAITEQRIKIAKLLKQSPSLKDNLQDAILEAYPDTLKVVSSETGLPKSTFPKDCPYTIQQLFDEDFYPDPEN